MLGLNLDANGNTGTKRPRPPEPPEELPELTSQGGIDFSEEENADPWTPPEGWSSPVNEGSLVSDGVWMGKQPDINQNDHSIIAATSTIDLDGQGTVYWVAEGVRTWFTSPDFAGALHDGTDGGGDWSGAVNGSLDGYRFLVRRNRVIVVGLSGGSFYGNNDFQGLPIEDDVPVDVAIRIVFGDTNLITVFLDGVAQATQEDDHASRVSGVRQAGFAVEAAGSFESRVTKVYAAIPQALE